MFNWGQRIRLYDLLREFLALIMLWLGIKSYIFFLVLKVLKGTQNYKSKCMTDGLVDVEEKMTCSLL